MSLIGIFTNCQQPPAWPFFKTTLCVVLLYSFCALPVVKAAGQAKNEYELFAQQDQYCEGEDGVVLGIHNTIEDETYTLQIGPDWTTIATITGSGGTVFFTGYFQGGFYRLEEAPVEIVEVEEISLPQEVFSVTGGGSYCANDDDHPGIGLDGSEPGQLGVTYELYLGSELMASEEGSGQAFSFGTFSTAGSYTARAHRQGCYIDMDGSAEVTVLPAPAVIYEVTGGGGYCENTSDHPSIILNGSENAITNIEYELYRDGQYLESLFATGSPLDFGTFSEEGIYTVTAILGSCSAAMSGEATVEVFSVATMSFTYEEAGPPHGCGSLEFSASITGGTSPFSYNWAFGDEGGSTNTVPNFQFPAFGNETEDFLVSLQLTDSNGCVVHKSDSVTVTQRPDATLDELLNLPDENTFAYCDASNMNPFGHFNFANGSSTLDSNIWYNINWGDGTEPFDSPVFDEEIEFTYEGLGSRDLVFTVDGQNGCIDTRHYNVFVGSTPSGGIGSPGNTYGVADFTLNFPVQAETYQNTPGTHYHFSFGDGNDTTFVNLPEHPNNFISHTYTSCSSIQDDNGLYAFTATAVATNACASTITTVYPIIVSCQADGGFCIGGGCTQWGGNGLDSLVTCNPVAFDNTSTPGFYIWPNGQNHTENTQYSWDFGDPESGANNTSSEAAPTHEFTHDNQWYEVTLEVFTGPSGNNNSGVDVITKWVYVQGPPEPDFIIGEAQDDCVPVLIEITDQSFQGDFGLQEYEWQLLPDSGWDFETAEDDPNPHILFEEAGTYHLRLALTNSCGTVHTDWEEIETVFADVPSVEVHQEFHLCGTQSVQISEEVITYVDNNSGIDDATIQWSVFPPGPTFDDDNSRYPTLSVHHDVSQTYSLVVEMENNCGLGASDTVYVHVLQSISNNLVSYDGNLAVCSGMLPEHPFLGDPSLSGGSGEYEYQWYVDQGNGWEFIINAHESDLTYNQEFVNDPTEFMRRVTSEVCESESNPIVFAVEDGIENNLISEDQDICAGDAPLALSGDEATGGGGGHTYLWEQSMAPFDQWEDAPGVNTNLDYEPPSLNQSKRYRRMAITELCHAHSNEIEVTVYDLIENNLISADTDDVCAGFSPGTITGSTPEQAENSLFFYQWQMSVDGEEFTDIEDATGMHFTPGPLLETTWFRRLVESGGNVPDMCNNDISEAIEIIVHENPVADAGEGITIQHGTSTGISGDASGGSGTYSWHWEPADLVASGQGTPDIITHKLYPPPGTVEFCLSVTDVDTECTHVDCVEIEIVGEALSCDALAVESEICLGEEASLQVVPTGGSLDYPGHTWTLPDGSTLTGESILHTPAQAGENIYVVEVHDGYNETTCQVIVMVNELPAIDSPPAKMICSGESVNYVPTASNVAGTSFAWTSVSNPHVENISEEGTGSINDVLINTSDEIQEVVYTILPTGPGDTFCEGDAFQVIVSVNPVAQVFASDGSTIQELVSGQSSEALDLLSNVSHNDLSFSWTGQADCAELNYEHESGSSNDIPSQFLEITDGGPPTCILTYTVHVTINGCQGPPFHYDIIVNTAPSLFFVEGGGTYCSGELAEITLDGSEPGIDYQLMRNGVPVFDPIPGSGDMLVWSNITQAGNYSIRGVNTSNNVSEMMSGQVEVIMLQSPLAYQVSVLQPGDNCLPLSPWLNGSELNATYVLQHLDPHGFYDPEVQVMNGSGEALVFDEQHTAGIYTMIAYIEHEARTCYRDMLGMIDAAHGPEEFPITPHGIICQGIDIICMESSEPGVEYELWLNNQAVENTIQIGDGNEICFADLSAPGLYQVHARDPSSLCEVFLSQSVDVKASPVKYNLEPHNSCPGAEIILSGCEEDIDYYLYFEGLDNDKEFIEIMGPLQCGESETLTFGEHFNEGAYHVKAINKETNCHSWMANVSRLYPAPEMFEITPQGGGCGPVSISLDNTQSAAKYFLFRDEELMEEVPGTGGHLSFSSQVKEGTYTVMASFNHGQGPSCWTQMAGSFNLFAQPELFSLKPMEEAICPPVAFFLNGSEPEVTYELWHEAIGVKELLQGTGDAIHFEEVSNAGDYWVIAFKGECQAQMPNTRTVLPSPVAYDITPSQGLFCEYDDVSIGLSKSDIGFSYELHRLPSDSNPQDVVAGTGDAISFPDPVSHQGTYIVVAVDDQTGCRKNMNGEIVINKAPTTFSITGNGQVTEGPFCNEVSIGINGSQSNVTYRLHLPDNSTLDFAGTGSPIAFGSFSAWGEYVVMAENPNTSCMADMDGSIKIAMGPEVFQLSYADQFVFCEEDFQSVVLELSGSQEGASYQLYRDSGNNPAFAPIPGSGEPIFWDNVSQHGEGEYFAVASFIHDTGCEQAMEGLVALEEIPLPTAEINGVDTICQGGCTEITLSYAGFEETPVNVVLAANEVPFDTLSLSPSNIPFAYAVCPTETTIYTVHSIEYTEHPHCIRLDNAESFVVYVHEWPIVDAGPDQHYCSDDPLVYLEGSVSGQTTSGFWTGGEGTFDNPYELETLYTPSENEIQAGLVMLILTSDIPDGPCGAVSDTISISFDPAVEVDAGEDQQLCAQSPEISLTGIIGGSAGGAMWWTEGGGSFLPDEYTLDVTYIPTPQEVLQDSIQVFLSTIHTEGPCEEKTDYLWVRYQVAAVSDAGPDHVMKAGNLLQINEASAINHSQLQWSILGDHAGYLEDAGTLDATYHGSLADSGKDIYFRLMAWGVGSCETEWHADTFRLKVGAPVIADFEALDIRPDTVICMNEGPAYFRCLSHHNGHEAHADQRTHRRFWDFGDGNTYESFSDNETLAWNTYDTHGFYGISLVIESAIDGKTIDADSLTMDVHVRDCISSNLFFPNALIPGHYDPEISVFQPKGINLKSYHLQIYDKKGNLIWESQDIDPYDYSPKEAWDGTYANGNPAPQGVYIYHISAEFRDGRRFGSDEERGEKLYGTITLIR